MCHVGGNDGVLVAGRVCIPQHLHSIPNRGAQLHHGLKVSRWLNVYGNVTSFGHSATADVVIFMFIGMVLVQSSHYWNVAFIMLTLAFCVLYRCLSKHVSACSKSLTTSPTSRRAQPHLHSEQSHHHRHLR